MNKSDLIILHVSSTPDMHHLVGAEMLSKTKPGTLFFNVSRGCVMDTDAVIRVLGGAKPPEARDKPRSTSNH